jgi:hypothetical protein
MCAVAGMLTYLRSRNPHFGIGGSSGHPGSMTSAPALRRGGAEGELE